MAGFMTLKVTRFSPSDSNLPEELADIDCPVWAARYSANGYMDCTDWTSAPGPIAAAKECFALYGDDTHGSEDRQELAEIIWQCRAQGFRS